ncbi:MAG: deoxyguanosinetriphosphate triphosphohydrolase, partial [Cypionkella sp.]
AERARVTKVINGLFPLFLARPDLLPAEWQADIAAAQGDVELARMVADYVSGMTDRFALQEGARLL